MARKKTRPPKAQKHRSKADHKKRVAKFRGRMQKLLAEAQKMQAASEETATEETATEQSAAEAAPAAEAEETSPVEEAEPAEDGETAAAPDEDEESKPTE